MNCQEYQEQFAAYLEGVLDEQDKESLRYHLAGCSCCRNYLEETAQVHKQLLSSSKAFTQKRLENAVMNRIMREQTYQLRRIKMIRTYKKSGLALAAAALIALGLFLVWPVGPGKIASAAEVLAQAADALSQLSSVHIKARMRAPGGGDNFQTIGPDYNFVEIELWKEFADEGRGKWRMESPARLIIMDGQNTVTLIRPNHAFRGPGRGWFPQNLVDVDEIINHALRLAAQQGPESWHLDCETGTDGYEKLLISVEVPARGDFRNDYLKNKSLATADTLRIFCFDAETKLLEGLEIYVLTEDAEVLIFEITNIQYNTELDPALFVMELPEDVIWLEGPQVLDDNERYARMSPKQMATAFFEACAEEDWEEFLKFWCASAVDQDTKDYLGDLEIVSIGEPFKSGLYPGWFVPYEVRLESGHIKKHNLAVRNDNEARRYIVDGGI